MKNLHKLVVVRLLRTNKDRKEVQILHNNGDAGRAAKAMGPYALTGLPDQLNMAERPRR